MFNFAPINWRNTIVFCILSLISGLCVAHISIQEWHTYQATKQAQAYVEHRTVGKGISAEVDGCVQLPAKVKGHKSNWACRVTLTADDESQTEIVQFTPDNLAGKPDPVEKTEKLEFDHSKDTNI